MRRKASGTRGVVSFFRDGLTARRLRWSRSMTRNLLTVALPTLLALGPACAAEPIADDLDTATSALSSIDLAIKKVFRDMLDRDPADAELAQWRAQLQGGGWSLASLK